MKTRTIGAVVLGDDGIAALVQLGLELVEGQVRRRLTARLPSAHELVEHLAEVCGRRVLLHQLGIGEQVGV